MFTGCPVIATVHSGQADLCQAGHCWPVEYAMEQARTHLTEGKSLWANPLVDSLGEQMRSVYRATAEERRLKTDAGAAGCRRAVHVGSRGGPVLGLLPGGAGAAAAGRRW